MIRSLLVIAVLTASACGSRADRADCERAADHILGIETDLEIEAQLAAASEDKREALRDGIRKALADNVALTADTLRKRKDFIAACTEQVPSDLVACILKTSTRMEYEACEVPYLTPQGI